MNCYKGLPCLAMLAVAVALLTTGCGARGRNNAALECSTNLNQWAARIPFSEKLSLEKLVESSLVNDFKQYQCPSGNPYFVCDLSNYDEASKEKVLVFCEEHRTSMRIGGAVALSSARDFKTIRSQLLNTNDVGITLSCFQNMTRNLACAKGAYYIAPKGGSLAKLAESLRKNGTKPYCPGGEPYWVCDPSLFDPMARVPAKVFVYCERHRVGICGNHVQLWDAADFKTDIPARLLSQNNVAPALDKAIEMVRMLSNR